MSIVITNKSTLKKKLILSFWYFLMILHLILIYFDLYTYINLIILSLRLAILIISLRYTNVAL